MNRYSVDTFPGLIIIVIFFLFLYYNDKITKNQTKNTGRFVGNLLEPVEKTRRAQVINSLAADRKLIDDFFNGDILLEEYGFSRITSNDQHVAYSKKIGDKDSVMVVVRNQGVLLSINVEKYIYSPNGSKQQSLYFTAERSVQLNEGVLASFKANLVYLFSKLNLNEVGDFKSVDVCLVEETAAKLAAKDKAVRAQLSTDFRCGHNVLQECEFESVLSSRKIDLSYRKRYGDGSSVMLVVENPDPIFNLSSNIDISITWFSHDHAIYPPEKKTARLDMPKSAMELDYIYALQSYFVCLKFEDTELNMCSLKPKYNGLTANVLDFVELVMKDKLGFRVNDNKGLSYIKKLSRAETITLNLEFHNESMMKTSISKNFSFSSNSAPNSIDFIMEKSEVQNDYIYKLNFSLFQIGLSEKAEPLSEADYQNQLSFYLDV